MASDSNSAHLFAENPQTHKHTHSFAFPYDLTWSLFFSSFPPFFQIYLFLCHPPGFAPAKIVWMRVCFDGLCFASRRHPAAAAVEQETQTVLCGATALDGPALARLLRYANFAAPTNGLGVGFAASPPSSAVACYGSAGKDLDPNVVESSQVSVAAAKSPSSVVASARSAPDNTMNENNNVDSSNVNQQQQNDTFNNNLAAAGATIAAGTVPEPFGVASLKQMVLLQGDLQQNLYINDPATLALTPREQELLKVIQARDIRIRELEDCLRLKHDEVAELRSHLDKFQSVFRSSGGATGASPGGRKLGTGGGAQRQRAQGISAEPQRDISVLELMHVAFPKYDKEDR